PETRSWGGESSPNPSIKDFNVALLHRAGTGDRYVYHWLVLWVAIKAPLHRADRWIRQQAAGTIGQVPSPSPQSLTCRLPAVALCDRLGRNILICVCYSC